MDSVALFQSQFLAALAMFEDVVKRCPASLWDDPQDQNPFWRVAFHTLFYTHLYLHPTVEDFIPWEKHQPDAHYFGRVLPESIHQRGQHAPYTPAEILDYLALCRDQVATQLPALDFNAPSGFDWLPFSKFELQIYTIRHIQHHVGELSERLAGRADVDELEWIGTSTDLVDAP